jgi:hypothetical protein
MSVSWLDGGNDVGRVDGRCLTDCALGETRVRPTENVVICWSSMLLTMFGVGEDTIEQDVLVSCI